MHVYVRNQQKELFLGRQIKQQVRLLIEEVLACEKQSCHEVSVSFVSEKKIAQLHDLFFDDPTVTDCITLPIDMDPTTPFRVLGEIFVCPKVAIDYTNAKGGDPYIETTLYTVHALLHLLGYIDTEPLEKRKMRRKEKYYMELLRNKGLLFSPPK
jgi:probable rRNA maturation factor